MLHPRATPPGLPTTLPARSSKASCACTESSEPEREMHLSFPLCHGYRHFYVRGVFICVHVCTRVCVGQTPILNFFFSHSSTSFLRWSRREPGAHPFCQVGQLSSSLLSPPPPPQCWVPRQTLLLSSEDGTQVLLLMMNPLWTEPSSVLSHLNHLCH